MPINIVLLRPQNWSRLKPYCKSTTTTVEVLSVLPLIFFSPSFCGCRTIVVAFFVLQGLPCFGGVFPSSHDFEGARKRKSERERERERNSVLFCDCPCLGVISLFFNLSWSGKARPSFVETTREKQKNRAWAIGFGGEGHVDMPSKTWFIVQRIPKPSRLASTKTYHHFHRYE